MTHGYTLELIPLRLGSFFFPNTSLCALLALILICSCPPTDNIRLLVSLQEPGAHFSYKVMFCRDSCACLPLSGRFSILGGMSPSHKGGL